MQFGDYPYEIPVLVPAGESHWLDALHELARRLAGDGGYVVRHVTTGDEGERVRFCFKTAEQAAEFDLDKPACEAQAAIGPQQAERL